MALADAGVKVEVVRIPDAGACDYCNRLALGSPYDLEDSKTRGSEVWARHLDCKCEIITRVDKRSQRTPFRLRDKDEQRRVNEEIMAAYTTSGDLQAKLETRDNLLLIRQIATEEYGMVDEEYVRTQYITLADKDSIEAYETEKGQGTSLSALLSAIGIR